MRWPCIIRRLVGRGIDGQCAKGHFDVKRLRVGVEVRVGNRVGVRVDGGLARVKEHVGVDAQHVVLRDDLRWGGVGVRWSGPVGLGLDRWGHLATLAP